MSKARGAGREDGVKTGVCRWQFTWDKELHVGCMIRRSQTTTDCIVHLCASILIACVCPPKMPGQRETSNKSVEFDLSFLQFHGIRRHWCENLN